MKFFLILLVGVLAGFSLATLLGKTQKQYVRVDAVTLQRTDLEHVSRAIALLKDKSVDRSYSRYEADSGSVAFDCPTKDACNLEVPARERVQPPVAMAVHEVPQPVIDQAMTQLSSVLKRARTKGSAPDGDSIYSRLDLKNGDIVTAINGENVRSPSSGLEQLQQYMKDSDQLREVTLLRNGQEIKISLSGHE